MTKYDLPLVTLDHNPLVAYFNGESDAPAVRNLFILQRAHVIRLHIGLSTVFEKPRVGEKRDMQTYAKELEDLGIDREDIFTSPRTMAFSRADAPGTLFFGIDPQTGIPLELWCNRQIHAILFEGKLEKDARNIPFYFHQYRGREYKRLGIVGVEKNAIEELEQLKIGGYIPPSPDALQQRPTPALDTLSPQRREELVGILAMMHDEWMNTKNDALGLYNHMSHALQTSVPQHAVFVTSDKNFMKSTKRKKLQALGFPGHIMRPHEAVAYLLAVTRASLPERE